MVPRRSTLFIFLRHLWLRANCENLISLTVSTENVTIRVIKEALTYHKRSQVLPVLAPISLRIYHLYNDRRVRIDGKFVVPERSSADIHQGLKRVFGGGKGFLDSQISEENRNLITITSPTS